MLGAGSHHMDDAGVKGSGVGGITGPHQSDEDDWSRVLAWCFIQCSRANCDLSLFVQDLGFCLFSLLFDLTMRGCIRSARGLKNASCASRARYL